MIPDKMQAVCIEKQDGPLGITTVPVPRPKPGEVLIKMAAAPVNPSDLARMKSIATVEDLSSFIPELREVVL